MSRRAHAKIDALGQRTNVCVICARGAIENSFAEKGEISVCVLLPVSLLGFSAVGIILSSEFLRGCMRVRKNFSLWESFVDVMNCFR